MEEKIIRRGVLTREHGKQKKKKRKRIGEKTACEIIQEITLEERRPKEDFEEETEREVTFEERRLKEDFEEFTRRNGTGDHTRRKGTYRRLKKKRYRRPHSKKGDLEKTLKKKRYRRSHSKKGDLKKILKNLQEETEREITLEERRPIEDTVQEIALCGTALILRKQHQRIPGFTLEGIG